MMNKGLERSLPPAKNLRRAFECAVRDIYQAGRTGKISEYRTPIVHRGGVGPEKSPVDAEKLALSDAAKALAQLWKVSASSVR